MPQPQGAGASINLINLRFFVNRHALKSASRATANAFMAPAAARTVTSMEQSAEHLRNAYNLAGIYPPSNNLGANSQPACSQELTNVTGRRRDELQPLTTSWMRNGQCQRMESLASPRPS
jgi:hypothetical protein